jgi:TolB-like protein/Tfp pilus assembly protein PilF
MRVAILYAVSSWILLQLADVLSSILPVPEWTGSFVFMLLAIGLFPALIFSWVYEMTPEGLKREKDIDRGESITSGTGTKINSLIVVLLIVAIAGMIADRLMPEAAAPISEAATAAPAAEQIARNTIAVLPFTDLSPEGDQQFFTDGLSEELLNLLARVDGLRVASRTSSFSYRGSGLGMPQISAALGVAHVLEGSVRKSGDRIRITAQLIEADTDIHLWSENFDRKLDDIFAIQDEIGNAIVNALKDAMGIVDVVAINVDAATQNVDAYSLYLEARELFIRRENLTESIRLFHEAIALDPDFARAWEGLAAVEIVADDWILDDNVDHAPLAREAAEKALALNAELSMPYAVLGLYLYTTGTIAEAMDYYQQAVTKDPKNTSAWLWYGITTTEMGFFDEGVGYFQKCIEIDPGYQNCIQHLADTYLYIGRQAEALELYESTLEWNFHSMTEAFVPIYVELGQRNLALALADIEFGRNGAPVVEWIRAIEDPHADHSAGFARLKEWERTKSTGRKLADSRHILLAFDEFDEFSQDIGARYATWHPHAHEFRESPQFSVMIRDGGTLAYWQERGFPDFCRPVGDDDFECDQPN